jgi:hypothetical protein
MHANMFHADRLIRLIISFGIVALYMLKVIPMDVALGLFIVATVFFVTGFTGFCPLYQLFGINKLKASRH